MKVQELQLHNLVLLKKKYATLISVFQPDGKGLRGCKEISVDPDQLASEEAS